LNLREAKCNGTQGSSSYNCPRNHSDARAVLSASAAINYHWNVVVITETGVPRGMVWELQVTGIAGDALAAASRVSDNPITGNSAIFDLYNGTYSYRASADGGLYHASGNFTNYGANNTQINLSLKQRSPPPIGRRDPEVDRVTLDSTASDSHGPTSSEFSGRLFPQEKAQNGAR